METTLIPKGEGNISFVIHLIQRDLDLRDLKFSHNSTFYYFLPVSTHRHLCLSWVNFCIMYEPRPFWYVIYYSQHAFPICFSLDGFIPTTSAVLLSCAQFRRWDRQSLLWSSALAHLFSGLLILHFLSGHVTTKACLDLGGCLICSRVIQWDVHDVLVRWLVAPLLIGEKRGTLAMLPITGSSPWLMSCNACYAR